MKISQAILCEGMGDSERAAALYEQALERFKPFDLRLRRIAGAAFQQAALQAFTRHDFRAALAAFEHMERYRPAEMFALLIRGIAHEKLGETEQALADFKRAAELTTAPDPAIAIANLWWLAGDRQTAETWYEQAQRRRPNNPLALINHGDALLWSDDAASARECYQQALALDAAYPEPHLRLARMLLDQGGATEDVSRHLEAVRAVHPEHPELPALAARLLGKGPPQSASGDKPKVILDQRVLFTLQNPSW